MFQKIIRVSGLVQNFEKLPQPTKFFSRRRVSILFVKRVSRNPVFRNLMHTLCPDLEFNSLFLWSNHGGMERLISVRLRGANIILKSTWNNPISLINYTQCCITILCTIDDYAKGNDVRNLFKRHIFSLCFQPNRVRRFLTS